MPRIAVYGVGLGLGVCSGWLLIKLRHELGDGGVGFGDFNAVEFSQDFVERPGQELAAGRAVGLQVALVVDGLEIILVVLQVHLAVQYDGIIVLTECLRLRAGVMEAFRKKVISAARARKVRE